MARHDYRNDGGQFAQDDTALHGPQHYRDNYPTAGSEPAGYDVAEGQGKAFGDHELGSGGARDEPKGP
jgi:hypothetical protein